MVYDRSEAAGNWLIPRRLHCLVGDMYTHTYADPTPTVASIASTPFRSNHFLHGSRQRISKDTNKERAGLEECPGCTPVLQSIFIVTPVTMWTKVAACWIEPCHSATTVQVRGTIYVHLLHP